VLSRSVAAAVASLVTAGSPLVVAQNEDAMLEEVVVTGSRLQTDPNAVASQPVTAVNSEDIAISGEFSISDVINDVPALFSSNTSENSIDGSQPNERADGTNTLNLRGLGEARTLVLVDGRRHVAGAAGTQAVDVGSIPMKLIERVEVLTGGASAVYGADAVTGVVNFILKDDFEGFDIDLQTGISGEGDANQSALAAIWGANFANGRGNIALAVDYRRDEGLQARERDDGLLRGSGRDWVNPDLRFQQGEISGSTPNFQRFFDFEATGLTDYGLAIPSQEQFIADYTEQFGEAPSITGAEEALFFRAANAPQRAVQLGRTFPFTSGYGLIAPGNAFTFEGFDANAPVDLDGNGRNDCLDSWTGYNTALNGAASFGALGGCWNIDENGGYAPVRDGSVASATQGFGGDGFTATRQPRGYIITPEDKATVNLIGHYDLTD
jgi:outer membrane receptor protein involved in Fe transport